MKAEKEVKLATFIYIIGVVWLFLNAVWAVNVIVCPLRLVTGLPCPACGITRSMLLLLHGEPWQAFVLNPNSLLVAPAIIAFTLALVAGLLLRKPIATTLYAKVQRMLNRKGVFVTFLVWEAGVWVYLLIRHLR